MLGSPVNPGITTSRSVVFLGDVRRSFGRAPHLQAVHRLHARDGRRLARPDLGDGFPPGRPTIRRVKTVRVRAGSGRRSRRAALLASASSAPPMRSRSRRERPRARASSQACPAAVERRRRSVVVRVRGDAELAGCAPSSRCTRSARGCVIGFMSFKSPWLLLGLVVLASAVGIWLLVERRRTRYAVRYTNLDVLATVVSGRSWTRLVPAVLVVLGFAVAARRRSRGPQVERLLVKERATVILVVDTSRSMQAEDVKPTRLGAAQEAIRTSSNTLRTSCASVSWSSRARLRWRHPRRRTTSSSRRRSTTSTVHRLRRNGHRRRTQDRGRAREA